jgi:surfeit locus 1 family protein
VTTTLRRLLVPTLVTVPMLAVLVGLGVWQVHRLAWKQDVLARLDRAEAAGPIPLPARPEALQLVRLEGRWRADLQATYGAAVRETRAGPVLGTYLIMPLETDTATFLVDRGWIPMGGPVAAPDGPIKVQGWLRAPDHAGLFSARDAPAERRFYTLDPQAIATALGIAPVPPFILVALDAGATDQIPIPATKMPRPPNDHLGYALTWFGLAASLLVVYGLYARRILATRSNTERA